MAHTLILACGNPLRGDDAVGWLIADALQRECTSADIEIEAAHQFVPEMAERISQAEIVIFVDASASRSPGMVGSQRVTASRLAAETFTHELDPQTLLALAEALYGRAPGRAFSLSVGAESFELNEGLSEAAKASIPKAVDAILGYIAGQTLPTDR